MHCLNMMMLTFCDTFLLCEHFEMLLHMHNAVRDSYP